MTSTFSSLTSDEDDNAARYLYLDVYSSRRTSVHDGYSDVVMIWLADILVVFFLKDLPSPPLHRAG